jgi:hypothetical protein
MRKLHSFDKKKNENRSKDVQGGETRSRAKLLEPAHQEPGGDVNSNSAARTSTIDHALATPQK